MTASRLDEGQRALLDLLRRLDAQGYDFTTITPASHRRLIERDEGRRVSDLRDLLGFSLPADADFAPEIRDLLAIADAVRDEGDNWRSALRVSRVGGILFLHSAYPTREKDAVFLGPDTYRFVRFLRQSLAGSGAERVVDIGAGAGVGGIVAARLTGAGRLQLTDVNPAALRLAAVNAAHVGVGAELVEAKGLDGIEPGPDLIVANPPFMSGSSGRTYSAGGDLHGGRLSLDWAAQSLDKLAPGGRMVMYTGSAILRGGRDRIREGVEALARSSGAHLAYDEIDPDIFGEVLRQESYADVERIAAVGVILTRA